MRLNELRDKAFAYAEKQGFHEKPKNLGELLMLVVSELSEALEADRNGKWCSLTEAEKELIPEEADRGWLKDWFEYNLRGKVEEELADAIIRICDIAGIYGIDLEWHVRAKMAYNETRPYLHGKKYG